VSKVMKSTPQANSNLEICALDLRDRDNLEPEMRDLVAGIEKKYGFLPNFVRLFASDNLRLKTFMGVYMELLRTDSGLTQLEHELIALVSAQTNGCAYCCAHHGALLRGASGDPLFAEYIGRNYRLAELSERHRAMLDFVVLVNDDPEAIGDDERNHLRELGYSDEAIWYIASTAAFYAYANRIAVAVGLKITPGYLDMHR